MGNLHTLANGIVSVNAYGRLGTTTFPLLFRLFKPETRLKPGDVYQTKPQLASEISEELLAVGFRFSVVVADRLYGASPEFIGALHRLHRPYVVAIRSNHGVWLLPGQRVRQTRWRPFARVFSDGSSEQRFIRATIYGARRPVRSYPIPPAPAPQTLPPATTWELMTNLPGKIERTVGNTFGLRTWVADGFKQSTDDRGWADDRLTDCASSARWWELVMSAETLVSLQSLADAARDQAGPTAPPAPAPVSCAPPVPLEPHPAWDAGTGWKHHLNTLRLRRQPSICSCLLFPWRALVPPPHAHAVQTGLAALGSLVNTFRLALPT
jgi:hypothetical protein